MQDRKNLWETLTHTIYCRTREGLEDDSVLRQLARTARWGGQEIELEAVEGLGWRLHIFSCYDRGDGETIILTIPLDRSIKPYVETQES